MDCWRKRKAEDADKTGTTGSGIVGAIIGGMSSELTEQAAAASVEQEPWETGTLLPTPAKLLSLSDDDTLLLVNVAAKLRAGLDNGYQWGLCL